MKSVKRRNGAFKLGFDKDEVVEGARAFYDGCGFASDALGGAASCLYWAACIIAAANLAGRRLIIQAGSASFRRLPPKLDDGAETTLTHFSYLWTRPTPERAAELLRLGSLPEMHVWAGDVSRQEVVDLSTEHLPDECQRLGKLPWLEAAPPRYVWCPSKELPAGWRYEANETATVFAARIAHDVVVPRLRANLPRIRLEAKR